MTSEHGACVMFTRRPVFSCLFVEDSLRNGTRAKRLNMRGGAPSDRRFTTSRCFSSPTVITPVGPSMRTMQPRYHIFVPHRSIASLS